MYTGFYFEKATTTKKELLAEYSRAGYHNFVYGAQSYTVSVRYLNAKVKSTTGEDTRH